MTLEHRELYPLTEVLQGVGQTGPVTGLANIVRDHGQHGKVKLS